MHIFERLRKKRNEESSLQLGLWSSCCREPESNVLATHHLSPSRVKGNNGQKTVVRLIKNSGMGVNKWREQGYIIKIKGAQILLQSLFLFSFLILHEGL
jgi:hypothetical protein